MSIESLLERIAVALENLANSYGDGEIISDQPAPSPQVNTSTPSASQAPPAASGKRTRKPAASQPAQPAASTAQPATSAPAAGQQAQSPAAPTSPSDLLTKTTDQVIKLANEYNRDMALAILGKRRGSKKCSELKPDELQGVYDEATAAIAQFENAKSNASLI